MQFPYVPQQTVQPAYTLGGARQRLRPIIAVIVGVPGQSFIADAVADSGADDTVFPSRIARRLGIDLDQAAQGIASGVGGATIPCRYASVSLRITDGIEIYEWPTTVAFADNIARGLLGHVGFFDFFDVTFLGAAKEVIVLAGPNYPGTRKGP